MVLVAARTRRLVRGLAAFGVLLIGAVLAQTAGAITLPAGFSDQAVTKVGAPTAVAFTPDGRILVTSQRGILYVSPGAGGTAAPALDLTPVICDNKERGLLGVAVDPAFSTNLFIYLYYTFKKNGSCDFDTAATPVNRVSRSCSPTATPSASPPRRR